MDLRFSLLRRVILLEMMCTMSMTSLIACRFPLVYKSPIALLTVDTTLFVVVFLTAAQVAVTSGELFEQ
jgi:hypothetical protein